MSKINWKTIAGRFIWMTTLLIIFHTTTVAQSVFEGQVLDSAVLEPLVSVTVSLAGKKIATSTNSQGYFKLTIDDTLRIDTLTFSSVGYITYKLAISDYKPNAIVILRTSNANLAQVNITKRKLKFERLNGFGLGQIIRDTAYVPTPYSTQFSFAKFFSASEDNAILSKIEIGRIDFEMLFLEKLDANNEMEPLMPVTKSNPKTRFLIHILSVNSQSRLPDKLLFTKSISIENDLSWVTVDLTSELFVLKSKEFFVAVEWLRIPYNEIFKLEWAPRVRAKNKNGKELLEDVSQYRVFYQPALASYPSTQRAPSYIKNKQGLWMPSSNDKEVALSATIKY
ncbi:carboxypeptidase-like regulatory domain-containing protein [Pedobacter sp. JCM 36344]|uniref:carboxypeptidase-like regulatory domain-containing protein n=1 Tax=Pedobacter sp. JCM 36344 TaxID=3374280 RepID=UPI00397AB66E